MNNLESTLARAAKHLQENDVDQAHSLVEKLSHAGKGDWHLQLEILRFWALQGQRANAAKHYRDSGLPGGCEQAGFLIDAGRILQQIAAYPESEECFLRAREMDPGDPNALLSHANLMAVLRRNSQAEQIARDLVATVPQSHEAHALLGNILRDQAKTAEAISCYRRSLAIKKDYMVAYSNLLLCLNYLEEDPRKIFADHQGWAESMASIAPESVCTKARPASDDRKLKIGYVSGHFKTHSIAYYLGAVLEHYDRSRFSVYLYSDVNNPDPVTLHFQNRVDEYRSICGMDNPDVCRKIAQDRIDILVDLDGHANNLRMPVFLARSAPLQVTYLGYPNTTGLPTMDYRLTDEWADPAGEEEYHSEKLFRLSGGFLCYSPPAQAPLPAETPALRNGFVTFGSFNTLPKLSRATIQLWSRLLSAEDGSRLLLKNRSFTDPELAKDITRRFVAEGVAASRIECLGPSPTTEEHLRAYAGMDIALDPHPYNGTTTTCEALWMGVPVISLAGNRHRARVGCSLLSQIGLTGMIAKDPESFLKTVGFLAGDIGRLGKLRGGLRNAVARSSLCNGPAFTRKLEEAFLGMWNQSCSK